ncbi:MAG: PLD nuclease N-terminal domain-containing protein [Xanthomonadales bacterium]|nr:PLD nuclease N-terminal domain-containing protein [Xanthomonadales bacterium]
MRTAFFVVVLLGLDAWAIYKTLHSSASTRAKALWSAVIVLLPLLGLVIWALAGPKIAKPEMYEQEPP